METIHLSNENIDPTNVNRQFLEHFGHHQHATQAANSLVLHESSSYVSAPSFTSGVDPYAIPSFVSSSFSSSSSTPSSTHSGDQLPPSYFSSSPFSPDMRTHPDQENFRYRRHRKRKGAQQQVQQRHAANLRERRRMQSINEAFEVRISLLVLMPNLSKE